MQIGVGTRLGPYEVLAPVGAGGMGEVYRARDTRLGREVAIKVLPSRLSSNPQLRERFDREARAIATLTHPHICTLFDVGHQEGTDYLVMEFLEGETLADRLARGPLPPKEVIRYGAEVAEGLHHAHRQGIVHRDLKPGNVMLTKAGAKVLDFGLAKYVAPEAELARRGDTSLATARQPITAEGTILGTIQYMAPEQLEGKDADERTDIFALGAILYEMATGRRAFAGNSRASLIASIMDHDPAPISATQPMTPPALDRVVRTCLEKDPDERWQSAHDVAREIQWIGAVGQSAGTRRSPLRRLTPWFVALLALLAGSMFTFLILRERDGRGPSVRFTVSSPELLATADDPELIGIAISPDGQSLAFTGVTGGAKMLFIRPLDAFAARVIPHTDGATFPFWSPDGRMIGFFADGKLKKTDVSGGMPQTICAAPFGRGATWGKDNVILFAPDVRAPLYRVDADGGKPEPATQLKRSENEVSHRWPVFLPNGRDFLYYNMGSRRGLHAASLDSAETRFIVDGSNAAYLRRGMLVYSRDKALIAQPFDPKSSRLSGSAVMIADDVGRYGESGPTGYATFTVSDSGVIAFRPIESARTHLTWFDETGKELGRLGPPGIYGEPSLSPDGSRITVNRMDPVEQHTDVWTVDLARGVFSRVTFGSGESVLGIWSPDGTRIGFSADRSGSFDLYEKLANGSGPETLHYRNSFTKYGDDWSPDGQFIVFEELHADSKVDLWMLRLSDGKPIPFVVTPFNETHAQFSRDGRFVAYSSDESGVSEIYVQSFPPAGGKWQISTAGGDQAIWGRDGKTLFYVAPDRKLMKVEIRTAGGFQAGEPVALFQGPFPPTVHTTQRNTYVPSLDGKRFLINASTGGGSSPIYVIVNWRPHLR